MLENLLTPPGAISNIGVVVPSGSAFFIGYLNILEGMKTKIKNFHWAAKKLSNADKRGTHLYLDEFLDIVSDFQDKVAESYQGILGEMNVDSIAGVSISCSSTSELISYIIDKTTQFYNGMPTDSIYSGIKSETEVFILNLNKYKYLFRLTE